MSRMKVMLAGLLAMLALGSVASATASALNGPWFRHPVGGVQTLFAEDKEQPLKGFNQGSFTLHAKVLGVAIVIKCESATLVGSLWNGPHQGQGKTEVEFTKCTIVNPCAGTAVTISPAKFYSELQWKYAGKQSELKETPVKQQKIYDVFAPTEAPRQNANNEARATFAVIIIPKTCSAAGEFPMEAAGTVAEVAVPEGEKQPLHKVLWGMAAEVNPQNQDSKIESLHWQFPNVTNLHHQESQTKAKLIFAGSPVELEGIIHTELNNGEESGAFNE